MQKDAHVGGVHDSFNARGVRVYATENLNSRSYATVRPPSAYNVFGRVVSVCLWANKLWFGARGMCSLLVSVMGFI